MQWDDWIKICRVNSSSAHLFYVCPARIIPLNLIGNWFSANFPQLMVISKALLVSNVTNGPINLSHNNRVLGKYMEQPPILSDDNRFRGIW